MPADESKPDAEADAPAESKTADANLNAVTADPTKTHVAKEFKHDSPLIACRFDPTGTFVFAGAEDCRVWRWHIESGAKAELAGHDSWTRAIAFHPGGEAMVTGGYDGQLIWWNTAEEKPQPARSIQAHAGWIRAVAVSPDGSTLASVGNDKLVKLWKFDDGSPLREMPGHEQYIYNVAFHPGGEDLVTGDLKANFIHWKVATGEQARTFHVAAMHKYDPTFKADIGGPRGMAFGGDGKQLAFGGITNVTNAFAGVGNPIVVLLDWESGKEKIQYLSKGKIRGSNWGVAIHPQGFTIGAAGGGGGGFLLFWKDQEQNEFHQLKLPNTARDLDLHPDGLHLATAHHDRVLRISKMAAKA